MRYYPVNLDLYNRRCLVVGGGTVGTRKVSTLLKCGADVSVVSIDFTKKLQKLSCKGAVALIKRPFKTSDLNGMFLVIGATDNEVLNRKISTQASRLNMLCNIADGPGDSNFILPAIVNRGDLIISISTSGKSPAFAKKLRKQLEKEFGEEYAKFLSLMGAVRKKLLSEKQNLCDNKKLFEEVISRGLLEMIKDDKKDDINSLLFEIFGKGYELASIITDK